MMGKNRGALQPFLKCENCNFGTKNTYIFKRHKIRCKRDVQKSKKVKPGISKPSGALLFASAAGMKLPTRIATDAKPEKKKSAFAKAFAAYGKSTDGILVSNDESMDGMSSADNSQISFDTSVEESPEPESGTTSRKHPYCRTYRCEKCPYMTTKSKLFLYHQNRVHNANLSVYSCTKCEYSCKHRHKVQRHLKLVHKISVELDEVYAEFMSEKNYFDPNANQAPSDELEISVPPSPSRSPQPISIYNSPNTDSGGTSQREQMIMEMEDNLINMVGPSGKLVYKCKFCLFNNVEKFRVAKHVSTMHVNAKMFKCTECDYETTKKIEYFAHKTTHSNVSLFHCEDCTYTTDFKPNYDRHRNNHITEFAHKCSFCSYSCDNEGAVRRHEATSHENDDENISQMFSNTTGNDYEYEDSMDSEFNFPEEMDPADVSEFTEPEYSFEPELPPPTGEPPVSVPVLNTVEGRFFCPLCGLKYKRSSDLNRHMKQKHDMRMRDYLGKTTLEKEDLMVAVTLEDQPKRGGEKQKESVKKDEAEMVAPAGDLSMPLDLTLHDEEENMSDMLGENMEFMGATPESLKCPYCTYQGKWPSDLRRHMSVHTVEKRYKCPHCEKQYKYVGDLNVHLRRDHQKEPGSVKYVKVHTIPTRKSSPAVFRCPSCSFSSPWKSEVDRHSKIHKDSKPYQCNYCNYQTHWKGDIRRHMYKHHPAIMKEGVILENVITVVQNRLPGHTNTEEMYVEPNEEAQMDMEDSMEGFEGGQIYEEEREETPEIEMDYSQNYSVNSEDISVNSTDISMSTTTAANIADTGSPPMNLKESPNGLFTCEYCNFTTNAPSKLKAHISTHMNLKQYMCPVCGRRANWKWDIRKHIKKDHPESTQDVVKLSRQEAEATIKTYIDSNPVVRREHHLNIPFGKDDGTDSPASSGSKKLYKCTACGFKSAMRWTVSRHIRTLHSGMAVDIMFITEDDADDAEVPKKASPPKSSPKSPRTSTPNMIDLNDTPAGNAEKPYKCFDCGKRCSIKADVRKHYHYIHPNKEIRIIYTDGNGDMMLPVEEAIQRSTSVKLQVSNENTPKKHNLTEEVVLKLYMCGDCGKKGANKGDIKKHYNYIHPDQEVKIIYSGGDGTPNMLPSQYTPSPKVVNESMEQNDNSSTSSPLVSNNPKSFGYVKPFKCSACGRRSNWKWDLNKHIRQKHNSSAQIITLSEQEARNSYEAYMREFSSIVHQSPSKNKKALAAAKTGDPFLGISHSNCRQFKCSGCPYRSNWRSDLLRHITRRHGLNKAQLIFLEADEAKETLEEYSYNPRKRRASGNSRIEPIRLKIKMPEGDKMGRIWKCMKCTFRDKDKNLVTSHLATHNIKAYRCTLCKYATNYRSSAFRHNRQRHNRDNLSFFRIGLKYMKLDQQAESAEIIKSPEIQPEEEAVPDMNEIKENVADNNKVPDAEPEDLADLIALENEVVDSEPEPFYDIFKCKHCEFKSKWKSCVCRHLRDKHQTREYASQLIRVRKWVKEGCTEVKSNQKSPKRHNCTICPYRTDKAKLLQFHMSCHNPQPNVQQEKCKYCPYYVVAPRLLHQHMKLHLEDVYSKKEKKKSPASSYETLMLPPPPNLSSKKYICEKCPYTTNSKNDYLYHKQFHRPNASAEFKCHYCDYWVTHKRLIKQHMKVHEMVSHSPTKWSTSSIHSSPCKSDISNSSEVYTTVQIAGYKQKLISSKITPSISQSPVMSPMKIACSVGNRPGYVYRNGVYKKLHKCRKCPYQNVRLRNLKLHEMMHGNRVAKHPLMKCPHCDYFVGSKGLLSHHLKVHQPNYMVDEFDTVTPDLEIQEGIKLEEDIDDKSSDNVEIPYENKVDSLLEIARFKKYSCEKCPYASAKRSHYERHIELHGSKQRCSCMYCDYSVPSNNLLAQHQRLHMAPNQNLLATQSFSNLTLLPEVPADVALASALPPLDVKGSFTVNVTHDHMDMYENSEADLHPKKLYRCDRCPYANVRRDHLLTHLKFHMLKSDLACPYCDYSTTKQHLLSQHIKVHFNPLPELSNWLQQNGQIDRVEESKEPDISEALYVAKLYQKDEANSPIKENKARIRSTSSDVDNTDGNKLSENDEKPGTSENMKSEEQEEKIDDAPKTAQEPMEEGEAGTTDSVTSELKVECEAPEGTNSDVVDEGTEQKQDLYICQYCDREFDESNLLLRHEMQHLIGNSFEDYIGMVKLEVKPEMNGVDAISKEGDKEEIVDSVQKQDDNGAELQEDDITGKGEGDVPVNGTHDDDNEDNEISFKEPDQDDEMAVNVTHDDDNGGSDMAVNVTNDDNGGSEMDVNVTNDDNGGSEMAVNVTNGDNGGSEMAVNVTHDDDNGDSEMAVNVTNDDNGGSEMAVNVTREEDDEISFKEPDQDHNGAVNQEGDANGNDDGDVAVKGTLNDDDNEDNEISFKGPDNEEDAEISFKEPLKVESFTAEMEMMNGKVEKEKVELSEEEMAVDG